MRRHARGSEPVTLPRPAVRRPIRKASALASLAGPGASDGRRRRVEAPHEFTCLDRPARRRATRVPFDACGGCPLSVGGSNPMGAGDVSLRPTGLGGWVRGSMLAVHGSRCTGAPEGYDRRAGRPDRRLGSMVPMPGTVMPARGMHATDARDRHARVRVRWYRCPETSCPRASRTQPVHGNVTPAYGFDGTDARKRHARARDACDRCPGRMQPVYGSTGAVRARRRPLRRFRPGLPSRTWWTWRPRRRHPPRTHRSPCSPRPSLPRRATTTPSRPERECRSRIRETGPRSIRSENRSRTLARWDTHGSDR
jgi:hypothetical protein